MEVSSQPRGLLVHPTGNRNVRAALSVLEAQDMLAEFVTSMAWPWASGPGALRHFPVPWSKIKTYPRPEICRLLVRAYGGLGDCFPRLKTSVDDVYTAIDNAAVQRLKPTRANFVYAYEDGAHQVFQAAKQHGARCVYELPIAYGPYARRLFEEEVERLPRWRETLLGLQDSPEKMLRKEREARLADLILAPSEFVRRSLPEDLHGHVALTPYGIDLPDAHDETTPREAGPMKILFVGQMSQRKGLADVLTAVKQFSPRTVELHLLGTRLASLTFYQAEGTPFVYHPPEPRPEVLRRMRGSDLLVLPSIVEGRALVQAEALSQGLPILVTPNAGGEDLVREGETGFLVPIRSPESIAEKIQWMLDHRPDWPAMREAARAHAASVGWNRYNEALAGALDSLFSRP